jgi:hypothetical protein
MNTKSKFGRTTLDAVKFLFLLLALTLASAGTAFASDAPSIGHRAFMRGQILESGPEGVVICIGRSDGAAVGQELDVVRHRRVTTGPKGMGQFQRTTVGKVRIEAIVDDHYAEAIVTSGEANVADSVELQR